MGLWNLSFLVGASLETTERILWKSTWKDPGKACRNSLKRSLEGILSSLLEWFLWKIFRGIPLKSAGMDLLVTWRSPHRCTEVVLLVWLYTWRWALSYLLEWLYESYVAGPLSGLLERLYYELQGGDPFRSAQMNLWELPGEAPHDYSSARMVLWELNGGAPLRSAWVILWWLRHWLKMTILSPELSLFYSYKGPPSDQGPHSYQPLPLE